jgi:hypothetical protein
MKSVMKIRTGTAIQLWALHVVIAAAVFAAACAEAPGSPTAPGASAGTLSSTPQAFGDVGATKSPASPQAVLLLTKTCDAIDHCTVITSPSGPIPVGSDINYFGPLLESRTTSRILVATPSGDTAFGNCSLSYRTFEGTCVITKGTGALVGLHANLKVSSDFVSDPAGVFTWEGGYHFER